MNGYRISAVLLLLAIAYAVVNGMRYPRATPSAAAVPYSGTVTPPSRIAMGAVVPRKEQLVVSFRLDPSLPRGLHLGDRWVSPPKYRFAQSGTRFVVQSKLQRVDDRGKHSDLNGHWRATDLRMVSVVPAERGEVILFIHRPGESTVTATAMGKAKVLHIRAWEVNDAMQAEITQ